MSAVSLVTPSVNYLPAYVAALKRSWSPDNVGLEVAIRAEQGEIAESPEKFVASLDDPAGKGKPIRLPDGAPRCRACRDFAAGSRTANSAAERPQQNR